MSDVKNVLITGATSGLGLSLVEQYTENGYHVIACGRNKEKLAELSRKNGRVSSLAFDITKPEQIAQAAQSCGFDIDILLLNAGDCQYIDDVVHFENDKFQHVVQTNLVAMGHMLSSFLQKVPAGGQVVFISSIVTTLSFPRAHAYGASKAGVDYLANTLRFDLIEKNINVCLVHPGFIKTPLTDKNDFDMPFIITSDDAAERIYQGVAKRLDYLQFPKRFTYLLKLMQWLPNALWHKAVFKNDGQVNASSRSVN